MRAPTQFNTITSSAAAKRERPIKSLRSQLGLALDHEKHQIFQSHKDRKVDLPDPLG